VAREVPGDGADAGEDDEVTEGHGGARHRHGDDVAEHGEPVVRALEAPAGADVDRGQLRRLDDVGAHERGGPHRHGPVDQHDGGIQGEPHREHAHPHELQVEQREAREQEQRQPEQRSGHGRVERREDRLQGHGPDGQARDEHHGVLQVGAEGPSQRADDDAGHGGGEHGDHGARR
jgi:hypothetical protein